MNLREETIKVLRPFRDVAKKDIGDDEADADTFIPMRRRYAAARLLTVGDLRAAAALLSRLEVGSGEETWDSSYWHLCNPDQPPLNQEGGDAALVSDEEIDNPTDRPHVATPAPGENSERANLELRLTELANAIERKSPSLALHDSRLVREAIRSLSTSYAAGRRSMRKKAARVVSQARFGEIDSDLRSILAAIRAIPEK